MTYEEQARQWGIGSYYQHTSPLVARARNFLGITSRYDAESFRYEGELRKQAKLGLFPQGLAQAGAARSADISEGAIGELGQVRSTVGMNLGSGITTGLAARAQAMAMAAKASSFGEMMMELVQSDASYRNQAKQNLFNILQTRSQAEQQLVQFYQQMRYQFGQERVW